MSWLAYRILRVFISVMTLQKHWFVIYIVTCVNKHPVTVTFDMATIKIVSRYVQYDLILIAHKKYIYLLLVTLTLFALKLEISTKGQKHGLIPPWTSFTNRHSPLEFRFLAIGVWHLTYLWSVYISEMSVKTDHSCLNKYFTLNDILWLAESTAGEKPAEQRTSLSFPFVKCASPQKQPHQTKACLLSHKTEKVAIPTDMLLKIITT